MSIPSCSLVPMAQPEPRKLHGSLSSQGIPRPMPCPCSKGAKTTLKIDIKRNVLMAGAMILGREQRRGVLGEVAKDRSRSSTRKGACSHISEVGKREELKVGKERELWWQLHPAVSLLPPEEDGAKGREYVRVCRKDQEFQSPHKGQKSIKVLTRDSNIRGQQGV